MSEICWGGLTFLGLPLFFLICTKFLFFSANWSELFTKTILESSEELEFNISWRKDRSIHEWSCFRA
jgi:hypothetical protein